MAHTQGLKKKYLRFIFVSLCATGLACGITQKDLDASLKASAESANAEAFSVFQTEVYPLLAQDCATCHSNSQSPFHAQPNPLQSYFVARDGSAPRSGNRLVDPTDIENSALLLEAVSNHCGIATLCGTSQTRYDLLATALQNWMDAEAASAENPGGGGGDEMPPDGNGTRVDPSPCIKTAELPLPAGLPNVTLGQTTFSTMSWNLASLLPSVTSSSFSIEVQQYSDDSYRVKNPTLTISNGSVNISGIKILVNGLWAPYENTYTTVSTSVTAPGSVLNSSTPAIIIIENGSALDQLSICFDSLSP